MKRIVLVAHIRFKNVVHAHNGTEAEKHDAAKAQFTGCFVIETNTNTTESVNILTGKSTTTTTTTQKTIGVDSFLSAAVVGGRVQNVLGEILSYV